MSNSVASRAIAALLASAVSGAALAGTDPSVEVSTAAVRRGSLPITTQAWGSAAPAASTATTVSLALEGEIMSVAATPGEAVSRGQTLLTFRPSAASTSQYRQAVTALTAARTSSDSTAALLARHLATKDMLAAADKAVSDAKSALDALTQAGAAAAMKAVQAPFAAVVTSIAVGRGQRVPPGAPLAQLTPADGLVVTVGVDPAAIDSVHLGQAASLTHLDRDVGRQDARVVRVDAVLDPRTQLVDVDLAPITPGPGLMSGEAFAATIDTGTASGWIVPHEAVITDDKGTALFQSAASHARRVPVAVLLVRGETDVVDGTLDPALPVIVDGSAQLSDGALVRTAPVR